MKKFTQEELLYLSSTFSKLLKRRLGKGPESCFVMTKGTRLYIYMRNFMTPAEEVLKEHDELSLAIQFRSTVIGIVIEEFLQEASDVLERSFNHFLHDWNYNSGTGVILLENPNVKHEQSIDENFKKGLFSLIEGIGSRYHKAPSSLKVAKYTQNICAVESKGILLNLESLVYETGNKELLLHHARGIKNGYIKHKKRFEDLFNRLIEDIFILWDYESDRHYLIFIFNTQ